eukprot:gene1467-1488_t
MAPGETEWLGLMAQLENVLDADSEVVLVAAGEPVAFACKCAVRSLGGPAGRARQMNAGAASARGRFLWFLHADTRLSDAAWPALQLFLDRGARELGWFDLAFRDDGPRPVRLNAWGANVRSRRLGIPFGDQGFVMPASLFVDLGGFDETAAYGEDHLLIWAARRAAVPLVPVGARLSTSARKYARNGWGRTTVRHAGSMTALAIFVKTPGLSPVKTRLAAGIGAARAEAFYRLAVAAVAEVALGTVPALTPYWAVAEEAGLGHPMWSGFATVSQGEGGLGDRLDHVYRTLQARHGSALLIGADAPQVSVSLLMQAASACLPFAMGRAEDGGFWVFGGAQSIDGSVWRGVAYSQDDTADRLIAALDVPVGMLPVLRDVDWAADLDGLRVALEGLAEPVAAQRALLAWLGAAGWDRRAKARWL